MPCSAKKASARSTKAGYRRGAFVVVELDVGEPGVVVDDRVGVVVADPGLGAHPVAGTLRAVAGQLVPWSQEASSDRGAPPAGGRHQANGATNDARSPATR
jgi:hypothetical protein